MAHALRSVGAHYLSSALLRRHQRSRINSERRVGAARVSCSVLWKPVQLHSSAAYRGTIAAGHTSRWEADSERMCSRSYDPQRIASVEQTRLDDEVHAGMPAQKEIQCDVRGGLTPRLTHPKLGASHPCTTAVADDEAVKAMRQRCCQHKMSFLSAFWGNSGSGQDHGAENTRRCFDMWFHNRLDG